MSKFNPIMAGLLLVGLGLAAAPSAMAAKAGAGAEASPLQRCVTESWHKVYTRADADYALVRTHLEQTLGGASPAARARGLDPRRPPLGELSFTVTIEARRCEQVPGGAGGWSAPVSAMGCIEVGCVDPMPGTIAPQGAIMVIESCEGGKRTTAVYERRGNDWVMVHYEQERSTECGQLGG